MRMVVGWGARCHTKPLDVAREVCVRVCVCVCACVCVEGVEGGCIYTSPGLLFKFCIDIKINHAVHTRHAGLKRLCFKKKGTMTQALTQHNRPLPTLTSRCAQLERQQMSRSTAGARPGCCAGSEVCRGLSKTLPYHTAITGTLYTQAAADCDWVTTKPYK